MINVTVNGVPVKVYVDEEVKQEINTHRNYEVGTIARSCHSHIITKKIRNTSGSRSGRGRIIFSASVGGAQ